MLDQEDIAIVSRPGTEAPLTSQLVNETTVSKSSGRIKSDWWSLRADLRPMYEYAMGKQPE
ncbi:MAG: hypothetical protein JST89_15645 [Cyanobacteria bacterium SZAS-4]|nr:hypothetical protein [Cyanobacteria bacterium SZAS-4]